MLKKLINSLQHQIVGSTCTDFELDMDVEVTGDFQVQTEVQAVINFKTTFKPPRIPLLTPLMGTITRVDVAHRSSLTDDIEYWEVQVEIDLTKEKLESLND